MEQDIKPDEKVVVESSKDNLKQEKFAVEASQPPRGLRKVQLTKPEISKPEEKEPIFAGLKLKKARVIKREIAKVEMEKVELVKQQFEKGPGLELVS